jgi:hypothetical protein
MSYLFDTLSETLEKDRLHTITRELKNAVYPWNVEQMHNGWPQAGYDHKTTDVKVRRIDSDDVKEVQFEIGTDEIKGKRLYSHSASFHVSLDLGRKLAKVLDPEPDAELIAALDGLLAWYSALPEPGLCPDSLTLSARLLEARAAIAKTKGERA